MTNEIKGIPGGNSAVSFDIYNETVGNEGAAIVGSDGKVKAGDAFDLTTVDGQKAYLQKLQSLGIRASDLPSFVTTMDTTGFVAGLQPQELAQLKNLAKSIAGLSSGGASGASGSAMAGVQSQWAEFISKQGVGQAMDVNELVQFVLRESYMDTTKDLQFYAQKVQFYNDLKKNIRDELTKARELQSTNAGLKNDTDPIKMENPDGSAWTNSTGGSGFVNFPTTPVLDKEGNPVPGAATADADDPTTKAGLDSYIKNKEEQLNSVGDDAQLANVDLQNILQKQQQTLQMMSNISKMMSDTALAIIRKIGG